MYIVYDKNNIRRKRDTSRVTNLTFKRKFLSTRDFRKGLRKGIVQIYRSPSYFSLVKRAMNPDRWPVPPISGKCLRRKYG